LAVVSAVDACAGVCGHADVVDADAAFGAADAAAQFFATTLGWCAAVGQVQLSGAE